MSGIFLKLLNMSISASWLALAVLLLRFLLKKAPKWINVLLWAIVGLRLLLPFSLESVFSLIPSAETISKAPDAPRPHFESGVTIVDNRVNDYLQGHYFEGVSREYGHFVDVTTILAILWLVGVAVLLLYTVISTLRIKHKVATAVRLRDNIYQSEAVVSPFVLGILKPRIYLPFTLSAQNQIHVIAHEQAHLRRRDHWWKPLGFLILTLHWFNPLLWLAYVLLCRDIELACDEKVVKSFSQEQKADYSQALLTCSVNRRTIAACPLAFGEVGVKDRVKSVLHYKKPAFWIILVAILVSIATAVCFLTNPKTHDPRGITSQRSDSELSGFSMKIIAADLSGPDPFLTVEWKNTTLRSVIFGEQFTLYRNEGGTWENCSLDPDPAWELVAYHVVPLKSMEHTYHLQGQNMTQPGKYRLVAQFYEEEAPDKSYEAGIEFLIQQGGDVLAPRTFDPVELVYDDGSYSYVHTAEVAPDYLLVNGMQLLSRENGVIHGPYGTFEEISLNEETFDSRFRWSQETSCWAGGSITMESLKKNNKRAWQLCAPSQEEFASLYLLLEQKDGTFYLGVGYYNCTSVTPQNPDDSHIRWLYRLQTIPSGGETSTQTVSIDEEELKTLQELYPQFFHVPTDGGLTVYVWQMAEDIYSCYLANTSLEAISDHSFAFAEGTTMAEMRRILTTYDVPREEITVQPIRNPLSNYYYELSYAYRKSVIDRFWSIHVLQTEAWDGKTPPYLTVYNGGRIFTPTRTGYSWTYANKNGTTATAIADAPHPLQMKGKMTSVVLYNSTFSSIDPLSATLRWEISPDAVTVTCWPESAWDHTDAKDEALSVTKTKGEGDAADYHVTLKDDNRIYQVTAHWGDDSAQYVFTTTRPRVSSDAVDPLREVDEWGIRMHVIPIKNTLRLTVECDTTFPLLEGTLTITPEYEIRAVYQGETISYGDYLRNVLNRKYEDKDFAWDTVLYPLSPGGNRTFEENLLLTYGILPPGEYVLCKKVTHTPPAGKGDPATKIYTAPFRISN